MAFYVLGSCFKLRNKLPRGKILPRGSFLPKRILRVLALDGSFILKEMFGPPDFVHRKACYRVFEAGMVMLGACAPPTLEAYYDLVKKFAVRYGQASWPFIYQAETCLRRDHLERIRCVESRHLNASLAKGLTTDFNPEEPWNHLYNLAIADKTYWHDQCVQPCILICAKAKAPDSFVQGDCSIAPSASVHVATHGALEAVVEKANKRQPGVVTDIAKKRQRTGSQQQNKPQAPVTTSAPAGDGARHTQNRPGNRLCEQFQHGKCTGHFNCPKDSSERHLCVICLGPRLAYGPTPCEGASRPLAKSKVTKKGKGKGK